MSTRQLPTKTSASQPHWIMCWWARSPSSSACKLAHALRTGTKVNLPGLIRFCCISQESWIVFSYCPALTYLASFLFHEKLSNSRVPGARAASFASTHGGFCRSQSQSAPCVFLCLKSGCLTFTFSDLQSHHCKGPEKNSSQSFSLWPTPRFPPQEVATALWPQAIICPNRGDSSMMPRRRTAITTTTRKINTNWSSSNSRNTV